MQKGDGQLSLEKKFPFSLRGWGGGCKWGERGRVKFTAVFFSHQPPAPLTPLKKGGWKNINSRLQLRSWTCIVRTVFFMTIVLSCPFFLHLLIKYCKRIYFRGVIFFANFNFFEDLLLVSLLILSFARDLILQILPTRKIREIKSPQNLILLQYCKYPSRYM